MLVQRQPGAEQGEVRGAEPADIRLDAHVSEKGGHGAEVEARGARGGVAGGGADVRAHHLGGKTEREPALDALPLERVVAVGGPDPVGALQDRRSRHRPPPDAQLSISTPGCAARSRSIRA